jgi:uncharacterized membrane protein
MNVVYALYIVTIILALYGIYIAWTVAKSKTKGEALVCSIDHDCNAVVNSKYGKTFGIENSFLGGIYYVGIGLSYVILLFTDFPFLFSTFKMWVLIASVGAALFSLYLMGVMVWIIKDRCDWCIKSAIISNCIALISIIAWFI